MKTNTTPNHGIPFGWHVHSQKMVTVSEVANGNRCDCLCITCGVSLQARQGEVRAWHFAHSEETECLHGPEAAIHRMAKQMIIEKAALFVPKLKSSRQVYGKRRVWSETIAVDVQLEGLHKLQDCIEEKTVTNAAKIGEFRRPDVLATMGGLPLAIEIKNTHAVDFEKQEWLRNAGFSVLEITVSDLTSLPPHEIELTLASRLFQSGEFSKWLVHIQNGEAQNRLDELERIVRSTHQHEEAKLLAQLEAREAESRRMAELREHYRDIEDFKIRLGQCTIRIGRNQQRVSMKIHGFASDRVFERLKLLAQKHQGKFDERGRCWVFFRHLETETFFRQLIIELKKDNGCLDADFSENLFTTKRLNLKRKL